MSAKVQYTLEIDKVINKLMNSTLVNPIKLEYDECLAIIASVKNEFEKEPTLLEIKAPIHVCGDIHGQFRDLLRLFDLCGLPPKSNYLFLGDYVDRGMYGVECLCLLFCLKLRYPTNFHLLRGNHESEILNRFYGFREEIKKKYYSTKLWKAFLKVFNLLPIAAVIENTVFCCHGGLSPQMFEDGVSTLHNLINSISRPCTVKSEGLVCDILWADPADILDDLNDPADWEENERGCSWTFGYNIVEDFLNKFNLDLIVRGHQVVEDGYEFFCNRKLVTIFSAPNYCGHFDNCGGIFCLSKKNNNPKGLPYIEGSFIIMKPNDNVGNQWDLSE